MHIFISYAHEDASYAMRLSGAFEALGIPNWIDYSRLFVGQAWEDEIDKNIARCAAFTVIMTPDAEASEWVQKEIDLARQHEKTILPILLAGRHFESLSKIQHHPAAPKQLPSQDFFERVAILVKPYMGDPILTDLGDKQRNADLALLRKIWEMLNSRSFRSYIKSLALEILGRDEDSNVGQYLRNRELSEWRFIAPEIEAEFERFDDALRELRSKIGLTHTTELFGDRWVLEPDYKQNDETKDIYYLKERQHYEVIEIGWNVLEKFNHLVNRLKATFPEFDFFN